MGRGKEERLEKGEKRRVGRGGEEGGVVVEEVGEREERGPGEELGVDFGGVGGGGGGGGVGGVGGGGF